MASGLPGSSVTLAVVVASAAYAAGIGGLGGTDRCSGGVYGSFARLSSLRAPGTGARGSTTTTLYAPAATFPPVAAGAREKFPRASDDPLRRSPPPPSGTRVTVTPASGFPFREMVPVTAGPAVGPHPGTRVTARAARTAARLG